jgi:uncharacterized glyoxalase superfamily protein PhnB
MADRSPRPKDTPWLSPYLIVKDVAQALEFYERAFGFKKKTSMQEPGGRITHAELTYQDAMIMLGPEGGFGGTSKTPVSTGQTAPVSLYVYCQDVDALFTRAKTAGAVVQAPPNDMFWGDRICRLADPDGHGWTFATHIFDYDPYSTIQE